MMEMVFVIQMVELGFAVIMMSYYIFINILIHYYQPQQKLILTIINLITFIILPTHV